MAKNLMRKNYDLGEGFYHNMSKYKSVKDFLKSRRRRKIALLLISRGIDFSIDDSVTPILDNRSDYGESVFGFGDYHVPLYDFEDKSMAEINHSTDYTTNETADPKNVVPIGLLENNSVNGLNREYDVESLQDGFEKNLWYGVQDSRTSAYRDI